MRGVYLPSTLRLCAFAFPFEAWKGRLTRLTITAEAISQ